MAKKLIQRGHRVTMVCASYGAANTGLDASFQRGRREGMVDGIRVIEFELPISNRDSLPKRTWTFLKFAGRSLGVSLTEKYDLIFATSTPLTAAIPGIAARWFRGKPFVFEVRDLWPELPKAMGVVKNPLILWAMGVLEHRAYKASRKCIGLAPGIVDGIARHVPADRVSLVPNGCDLDLLDPSRAVPWRPAGISEQDFVAVFTGTHGPANGLSAVLDVAVELKRRGRVDVKLLLVGDGKTKDGLQSRARELGLGNVIFHPNVKKDQIPGLLAGANVGMQVLANIPAFYFGTSPNKFFDYLAAGKAVINNYPGWVAKLITENRCGIACPADDTSGFADALIYLADNPVECREMGLRARQLAQREFDRDRLSDRFCEVLESAGPGERR